MINISNITLRRGIQVLLQDTGLTIFARQKIGVVGKNGCGKSSLFGVLRDQIPIDSGKVELPAAITTAYLSQEVLASADSAVEFTVQGDHELMALENALIKANEDEDYTKVANLHMKLQDIDGYSARARAAQILHGLGFLDAEFNQPMQSFSGGWRMRLNLAQTLMCRSDLLLLDEPTNHLDLEAVVWLEKWLLNYQGTLLIISHDREFLDNVTEHIIHIEAQKLNFYSGNYSSFEQQRAAARELQQKSYDKQQKVVAHLTRFVERFRAKASKAKQAQSRMKALEKLDRVAEVHDATAFQFEFKTPIPCTQPLLSLEQVQVGYGPKIILDEVKMRIGAQDRIGLLGINGAGKSTLIKCLAGENMPSHGVRFCGKGLTIGYFAQHQLEQLIPDDSPLRHLQDIAPRAREQELRSFLGSFGFRNEYALSPIANFSGGEKARLVLALIVWQAPNLLLLDEPTNHLDMEMRDALILALQNYSGAMVIIAHDRFLLRSTCDQFYWVKSGRVQEFDGDIEDYLQQQQMPTGAKSVAAAPKARPENQPEKIRELQNQIAGLDRTLQKLSEELRAIDALLAQSHLYEADKVEQLKDTVAKRDQLIAELSRVEHEWLQAVELLENNK